MDHDTTFSSDTNISGLVTLDGVGNGMHLVGPDGYQSQDGFGTTHVIAGSPESVDNHSLEPSLLNPHKSYLYNMKDNNRYSPLGQIFTVTDISPSWAISTEETKVISTITLSLFFLLWVSSLGIRPIVKILRFFVVCQLHPTL